MAGRICAVEDAASCCFSVKNISMGMAICSSTSTAKLADSPSGANIIRPLLCTAMPSSAKGVFLGPYCVIGAGARIGDGCLIGAHCVVENAVSIGARSILHPHVFVGAACQVGEDCEIHPHTSIGSDGFWLRVDADGKPRKIAHLGNVPNRGWRGNRQQLCHRSRDLDFDSYSIRHQAGQHLSHCAQLRSWRKRLFHGGVHDGRIDQDRTPVRHRRQFRRYRAISRLATMSCSPAGRPSPTMWPAAGAYGGLSLAAPKRGTEKRP